MLFYSKHIINGHLVQIFGFVAFYMFILNSCPLKYKNSIIDLNGVDVITVYFDISDKCRFIYAVHRLF